MQRAFWFDSPVPFRLMDRVAVTGLQARGLQANSLRAMVACGIEQTTRHPPLDPDLRKVELHRTFALILASQQWPQISAGRLTGESQTPR